MRLKLLLSTIFLLSVFSIQAQKNQSELIAQSDFVQYHPQNKSLKFIRFSQNQFISTNNNEQFLKEILNASANENFEKYQEENDKLGYTHFRYRQKYHELEVEDGVYYIHTKAGRIVSANGEYYPNISINKNPQIPENQAFETAKADAKATKFAWEEEHNANAHHHDRAAKPEGELVVLPFNNQYKLAYKFDIHTIEPMSRNYVYIDAQTGVILQKRNRIHHSDSTGRANTKYSGTQDFTTDWTGTNFRLRESGRGNGIETYDLNTSTNKATAVDFTNATNIWTSTINQDDAALDAHWGAEKTYDYLMNEQGRNSIDNMGFALLSYVHYSSNYTNAFWNGTEMTYGDGGTGYTALTSLDIVAHEIVHGLTEFTADLVYSREPGALNESFSDIFGVVVDYYANPSTANWLMGDQISTSGTPFRNMQNPNQFNHPDTYLGTHWWTSSGDNYGVHTNSGVQNFWFYLLVNGGTGTNDKGDAYSVSGIGMDKAADIAYRNLTVYLSVNSQYADARNFAIQSAVDLFGSCSPEVIAVTNAWHAVGVGNAFANAVIADFEASQTFSCTLPSTINFTNNSTNGLTYLWDFGDGNTSIVPNPSHTYTSAGTFTVRLITNGMAACGNSDTLTRTNYIQVVNTGGPVSATCTPNTISGTTTNGIFDVQFNGMINTTGGGIDGYQDFTCTNQTTVTEGLAYPMVITTGFPTPENVRVWIDLNSDGNFNNTNELVMISDNLAGIHLDTIIIPATDSVNRPLRMRIGSDVVSNTFSSACSPITAGQYEDYTITILPNNAAPMADFTADRRIANVGQLINFRDRSLNAPDTWRWNLPGAIPGTSTSQNPSVIYGGVGTYDAELIVTNTNGNDTILKPNYIQIINTFNMCSGTTVTTAPAGILYDSGGANGNYSSGENCDFLINPSCATAITLNFISFALECCCDFVTVYDGTDVTGTQLFTGNCTTLPPTLTALSGAMYIRFTSDGSVTNSGFEATWQATIPAGTPPTAAFTISDNNPALNQNVTFTDNTSNAPIFWIWDFGDGNTSNLQNPVHNYTNSGTYTVTLIADNCFHKDTISQIITVQAPPMISTNPSSLTANLACTDSTTLPLKVYNTGAGDLIFNINNNGINGFTASSGTIEILALEYGADLAREFPNTISGFSTYLRNYNLTQINTTDPTTFQNALVGKDVLLFPEFESANITVLNGFQTAVTDFINNGGTFITCGTITTGVRDYIYNWNLFTGNYIGTGPGAISIPNPNHPLMDSITGLAVLSATAEHNFTNLDVEILGESFAGNSVIALRKIGKGQVIFIGYDYFNFDANSLRLMANAAKISSAGNSILPSWLSVNPDSAFVTTGDSVCLQVKFNSTGLFAGTYNDSIVIVSNDSINPNLTIPATLIVAGPPKISLSNALIDFGNVRQFTIGEEYFHIFNQGCDTLEISSLTNALPQFVLHNIGPLSIPPNSSDSVRLQFLPTSIGFFQDTVWIFNNDVDTFIVVQGNGQGAPVISVAPNSINANIQNCGDSICLPLTIYNTGLGDLNFQLSGGSSQFYDSTSTIMFFTDGATTSHQFGNLASSADTLFLEVTINGDYDATSEFATLWIEGTNIAQINDGNVSNGTNIVENFIITGPQVATYLADGILMVDIVNSIGVNDNLGGTDIHQVRLRISGESWFSVDPNSGTIPLGDSTNIQVKIKSEGLDAGIYSGTITINSDDPINPVVNVPVNLILIGNAILNISNNHFDFDTIQQFSSKTDTLYINNSGCANMVINNIFTSTGNFSPNKISTLVPPNESDTILITYNPQTVGRHLDTLQILGNGGDTTVSLTGFAIGAPFISVNPDTLRVQILACDDSLTVPLKIYNTGMGDLDFEIQGTSGGGGHGSGDSSILVIQETSAWGLDMATFLRDSIGVTSTITVITSTQIAATDFSLYDLIITVGDESTTYYNNITANVNKFETFVQNGGTVQYQLATQGANVDVVGGVQVLYGTTAQRENNNDILLPNHPIMVGLMGPLTGNNANHTYLANLPPNAQIITQTTATMLPTTAEYPFGNGRVLVTGMTVEYLATRNFTANQMLRKTSEYIVGNLLYVPPWLSWTNGTDTVAVGDSSCVPVKFNGLGLGVGTYSGQLTINSNAPNDPNLIVPCIMEIIGNAEIHLDKNSINFGSIQEFTSAQDTILVSNQSCDTLRISSMQTNLPFAYSPSNLDVPPYETDTIFASFSPTTTGNFSDTLFIFNNDVDTFVLLNGIGTGAPRISINPTSFNVNLRACDDSISLPMKIYNTGGSNLNYNILGGTQPFDSTSTHFYIVSGATSVHNFNNLSSSTDTLTVEITLNGDFDSSVEFATLSIDGISQGIVVDGNPPNGTDIIVPYVFTGTTAQNFLADRMLSVQLVNDPQVGIGLGGTNMHRVRIMLNGEGWVTINPKTGSVAVNDSSCVMVNFNSQGLTGGTYTTTLMVNSNDPLNPTISVPCTLTVANNPCVDFNANVASSCSGSVQFIDQSINNPTSWHWSFGNGDTSILQSPTYAYPLAGTYQVRLIACNASGCDTSFQSVTIANTSGPRAPTCMPATSNYCCNYGIYNVELNTLNHASGSAINGFEDFTCTAGTSLSTGNVYRFEVQTSPTNENARAWIDYNDNGIFEPTEEILNSLSNTVHVSQVTIPFTAVTGKALLMRVGSDETSRTLDPCLSPTRGQFEDYAVTIVLDTAGPVINMHDSVIDACLGLIQFRDSSSRFPIRWHWDFGDGDTSSLQHPVHQYTQAGLYTVVLTAYNQFGFTKDSIQVAVNVLNPDIQIAGVFRAGSNLNFSTSTVGAIGWEWDFGDGNTSMIANPIHAYGAKGNYNVKLIVQNGLGCRDSVERFIFIDYGVGIQDLEAGMLFDVFPNPNKGKFTINYAGFENDLQLEILNPLGQIVHNQLLTSPDEGSIQLDLANQAKGIYLIKLISDGKIYTKRVTILNE